MNTMQLTIMGIVVALGLIALCIFIVQHHFKKVFQEPRRTKETMLTLLEEKGICEKGYYESLSSEELKVVSEDGYMLRGQYVEFYPKEEKVVIFIHDYTSNHISGLQFTKMYKAMGYNVLLIDARSHGESGAMYPTYGIKEMQDIKRWVNVLKNRLGDNIKVGLHGQGMGAATALMYGGEYGDVAFIIADSSYSNVKGLLPKSLYKTISKLAEKKIGILLDQASPEEIIKKSQVPVLFLHGTEDKLIPCKMSEQIFTNRNNSKDRLVLIEGANHEETYSVDEKAYEKAVEDFIACQ